MAGFIKGDVVVVPFPFSDLTQAKRRPALVITVDDKDFETGSLKQPSNVRPNRLFTADNHIILYKVGSLKAEKLGEIIEKATEIIQNKFRGHHT